MGEETSLWFDTPNDDAQLLSKISSPKRVSRRAPLSRSISDRLEHVRYEVRKILGQHEADTILLRTKEELMDYITASIAKGIVAVDTETNNSTEPITCKLMGLCLYADGLKQAYAPVNHVNPETGEKLVGQLTEEEIGECLAVLRDSGAKCVFHNAVYDIRVLQCQCGVVLKCYWDTRIGCRILDENESVKEKSNLKYQYMLHVDPNHGKYDIESLFDGLEYAIVEPELFALYAATDPMMTYRLYEFQLKEFEKPGNEGLMGLYRDIEIPLVDVVKDMELRGITVDMEYHARLKAKYDAMLAEVEKDIREEMERLQPRINAWLQTPDARTVVGKKTKAEKLENPINLGSPEQFAILLYDILGAPVVNKEAPRGTGESIVTEIYERTGLEICRLLIERRRCTKLLSAYIDNIPELLRIWGDGKIRAGFDQNGTDTGRFTSGGTIKLLVNGKKTEISGINLQTIPSHNKEIRMLYQGSVEYRDQEEEDGAFAFDSFDEVQVNAEGNWTFAKDVKPNDRILDREGVLIVVSSVETHGHSTVIRAA